MWKHTRSTHQPVPFDRYRFPARYVEQREPLGQAHAYEQAAPWLSAIRHW